VGSIEPLKAAPHEINEGEHQTIITLSAQQEASGELIDLDPVSAVMEIKSQEFP